MRTIIAGFILIYSGAAAVIQELQPAGKNQVITCVPSFISNNTVNSFITK